MREAAGYSDTARAPDITALAPPARDRTAPARRTGASPDPDVVRRT